jgi:hypothetical protein
MVQQCPLEALFVKELGATYEELLLTEEQRVSGARARVIHFRPHPARELVQRTFYLPSRSRSKLDALRPFPLRVQQ